MKITIKYQFMPTRLSKTLKILDQVLGKMKNNRFYVLLLGVLNQNLKNSLALSHIAAPMTQ